MVQDETANGGASGPLVQRFVQRAQRMAHRARLASWRSMGASIAPDVRLFGRATTTGDLRNLRIGAGSTVNEGVHLNLRDRITIGRDVHLSSAVQLHTGHLIPDIVPRVHRRGPIEIHDHAWVASGAVVGCGVTIGAGAVVAANSVVTEDVAADTMVGGAPARLICALESAAKNGHGR